MLGSRAKKSIKNSIIAVLEQAVYSIMSFACRTVFIYSLGKTYLGFSGLFSDIFTLLSLAELGAGTAIIYSMYKPVAENEHVRVAALLNLYRRFYQLMGVAITIVGLCLTPFLNFFVSDIPDIPELPLIYILYLVNTTASYFFIYKKSILITDQKNYIASLIFIVVTTIQNSLQIVFLLVTKNYIIYLVLMLLGTVCNNLAVSIYVDRKYKYLKDYQKERVDNETKKSIFKNVRAMFLSKVSSAVVTSTDNILISKYVSTISLGLYSNYTLFTTLLRAVFTKAFEGLTGSVGNLIATENNAKVYDVFNKIWFVNFWLVSFCSSTLFVIINPFIELWIGKAYLLDMDIVFMVCINFYIRFIRNTFIMLTDTYGLFSEFKVKCVCEAILNLVVSLVFVRQLNLGILGILLGTIISNLCTNFWYEPYIIYKKKFNVSLSRYFARYFVYLGATVLATSICFWICGFIGKIGGWVSFVLEVICCFVVTNTLYVVFFHKTEEFGYLYDIIKNKVSARL